MYILLFCGRLRGIQTRQTKQDRRTDWEIKVGNETLQMMKDFGLTKAFYFLNANLNFREEKAAWCGVMIALEKPSILRELVFTGNLKGCIGYAKPRRITRCVTSDQVSKSRHK
jgi:hypothetical protein